MDSFVNLVEATACFQYNCEIALAKIAKYEQRIKVFEDITEEERETLLYMLKSIKLTVISNLSQKYFNT
jgi:hypothetical protein